MERESFEDEEVAEILNKNFVSIKVDREERPDIDHIYMTVCQALTGHGGWPLTIFMTPDKKPFYAGTYFPKHDRMGLPGFVTLLNKVSKAWGTNRESLIHSGNEITNALKYEEYSEEVLSKDTIDDAYEEFTYSFDSVYGGFGSAPKFPTPHNLMFLLRYWYSTRESYALKMVEKTLDSMYKGGIYDHVGFGFSRYSTDRKWLVPHFEKMLYDNALLAIAYIEAYQCTKKEKYAEVAREIFTYILRDMTSEEGGFFSAEDADSEGIEGKFYVWTVEEVKEALGNKAGEEFCKYYNIRPEGNFEGKNIPNLINTNVPEERKSFLRECRNKLFQYREKRVHPYKDDKILTSWNSLMIAAMAIGGRVLDNDSYIKAAEKALNFILSKLVREDGRLLARYRKGEAAYPAYVDDYAFLVWALIELYESTYKPLYLQKALEFNSSLLKLFWDKDRGGLYLYGNDGEQLLTRPKEIYDGATPSGNSVAALNFLRLARLTGNHDLEEKAHQIFKLFGSSVKKAPRGYAYLLSALLFSESTSKEVVIVGSGVYKKTDPMLEVIRREFSPFTLTLYYSDEHSDLVKAVPFIKNYKAVNGRTTAYVCENFSCQSPTTDSKEFYEKITQ